MASTPQPRRHSIKSKVTAALLLVALVPLGASSLFGHLSARRAAERQAIDGLAGIAAVQEARVNAYASSSLENLALVASRTQLRLSFAAELEAHDEANVALMQRILGDAASSSVVAQRIEFLDLAGKVIASSDGEGLGVDRSQEPAFEQGQHAPDVSHVSERGGQRLGLHAGPVTLDGVQLGVVVIEASLDPLDRLMSDRTGLGESGETLLADASEGGSGSLLGPVRFPDQLQSGADALGDPLTVGLAGTEGVVSGGLDYRSVEVFAVARTIDAVPGWALVVKIDESEALGDSNRLRNRLTIAFVAWVVMVLVAARALARALSRPIIELHDAAVAVAGGETDRRAEVHTNDELSELAAEFNRMTDELTAANARLRLTNEQLEEFVHISSHDLKSPLRSVSSFGQLLQANYGDLLDEQGSGYLNFIRDGTSRMHRVIDDLLEYLRIEKDGHVVESVDLDNVLDDVIELHRPDLDAADVDLRRQDLPPVEGSTPLIRQLFDNVFQNAIRYRVPGRPLIIDITSERVKDDVRITIADNGVGVPADRREDAFTVFKRLSDTGDGSGMGLAICRRIAERHGGEMLLADSDHGGVAVVIVLPASSVML